MPGDNILTILLIGAAVLMPLVAAYFHSLGYSAGMTDTMRWVDGDDL